MSTLAHSHGAVAWRPWRPGEGQQGDDSADLMLVRAAGQGDVEACRELIRRYQDRIYSVAYSYVHDREEALDITQDTLLRMVDGLPRFREQAHFFTWLYRIVVNRCIDWRRSRTRRPPPESLEELIQGGRTEMLETRAELHPHQALESKELREQIDAAIALVPDVYRVVVTLADVQGLSNTEIAQFLGCPINTVKSRLHRGRLVIREHLATYLRGDDNDMP